MIRFPKKVILGVIIVFLIVSVLLLNLHLGTQPKWGRVCIRDNCFNVELAQTPDEWAHGLMFRSRMDEDKGMLLILEKERDYSDWMKNTLIPLDILWINQDKEVVYISNNTPPCKMDSCPVYTTERKARYILEVNGGIVNRTGISVGDKATVII